MIKFLFKIIIFLLIVSCVAFFGRDIIAKAILQHGASVLTNLKLTLEDVDVNIGEHVIAANGLRLYNPPGFDEAVMADILFVKVDYDLVAAVRGTTHLNVLKLDLGELLIERNKKGHLNFMSIKTFRKSTRTKSKIGKKGFKIDKLYISIGRVVYRDYYKKAMPDVKTYNVNLKNQLFENIDSADALVSAVMNKVMLKTKIHELLNYNINILQSSLGGVMDRGGVIIKEFTQKASQATGDSVEGIKSVIKNIFNKGSE